MPAHHQHMDDWNPQRLINWAKHIGKHVETVISYILSHRKHPEQGYKVCMGILNLVKRFDNQQLDKACQRAIYFNNYSYKGIKLILDNKLEDVQLDCFEPLPDHQNIRGHHYFQ